MECEACSRSSELQSQCRYCRRYVCREHVEPSNHGCQPFELLHPALDFNRLAEIEPRKKTIRIAAASLAFMVAGLIVFSPLAIANYIPASTTVAVNSVVDQAKQEVFSLMKSLNNYVAPVTIDSGWVNDFTSILNQHRSTHLTYCPALDGFAKLRFAQLTGGTNWQISKFGLDKDSLNYFDSTNSNQEDVLYPAGYSPRAYYDVLAASSRSRFGVMDPSYAAYSFYVGTAPSLTVQSACLAPTPAENVNMTQYYSRYGCQTTVQNAVWLVFELTPTCSH